MLRLARAGIESRFPVYVIFNPVYHFKQRYSVSWFVLFGCSVLRGFVCSSVFCMKRGDHLLRGCGVPFDACQASIRCREPLHEFLFK